MDSSRRLGAGERAASRETAEEEEEAHFSNCVRSFTSDCRSDAVKEKQPNVGQQAACSEICHRKH